jgi:AraC-like DNA-binding protein
MRMRWEALPSRPQDRDTGRVCSHGMMAIHSMRPAHVHGPRNCCHPLDLELSFLERGTSFARVGGREVVLRPGTCSVISAGIEHQTHTRDEGTQGLYMQMRVDLFDRVAEELGTPRWGNRWTEPLPIPSTLRGVLSALKEEVVRGEDTPMMIENLGLFVAGHLLRAHRDDPNRAARSAGLTRQLQRSIELMRACIGDRLSLEELAQAAGMSKFRYAHAFKDRYGCAPGQYLQRLRVDLAAEKLETSTASIASIAHEVGFSSASRFARDFRRAMGVFPSDWRRRR